MTKVATTPWTDLGIAFSLANICYLRLWAGAPPLASSETLALLKAPPGPPYYGAAALNVIFGAALLWLALWLWRGSRLWLRLLGATVLIVASAAAANTIHVLFARHFSQLWKTFGGAPLRAGGLLVVAGSPFILLACCPAVRRRISLPAVARTCLLSLLPLVPMNFAGAVWASMRHSNTAWADQPSLGLISGSGSAPRRVVWIVFDEWDQRLTFEDPERPPLPSVERFSRESLYADHATSPGPATVQSFAGLVTGRIPKEVRIQGPDAFEIRFADGTRGDWKQQPTVFSRARAARVNTGVLGWGLPHCRLYGGQLATCAWAEWTVRRPTPEADLTTSVGLQFLELFDRASLSSYRDNHASMLNTAIALATDPRIGLALIHLPDTHWPYLYDPEHDSFGPPSNTLAGYRKSLVLADRSLGRIRTAMETAGVWNNTTVLVTADHWMRYGEGFSGTIDRRVPFLLKIAGQPAPLHLSQPFNTVVAGDLLLDILSGRVDDSRKAAAWIQEHHR